MVIDFIKTKDRAEALAVLARHLESGEPRYASMSLAEGEFTVGILQLPPPTFTLNFKTEERDDVPPDN